jgi:hypothetical protein
MTLLTQREAALALRLSERTLERMRCAGKPDMASGWNGSLRIVSSQNEPRSFT